MTDEPQKEKSKEYSMDDTLSLLDQARHIAIEQSINGLLSEEERAKLSEKAEKLAAQVEELVEQGIDDMTSKMSDATKYQEMNDSLQKVVTEFNASDSKLVSFEKILHVVDQAIDIVSTIKSAIPGA